MQVVVIPCLRDNYSYLLIDDQRNSVIIDPSQSAPVLEALAHHGVTPTAVWCTHHHPDHTGGVTSLLGRFPGTDVVGHEQDRGRIPCQTVFAQDDDRVEVGQLRARVIYNPGHTRGAVSYFLDTEKAVFTGDTLFLAGCGRLFEGDAKTMHDSLWRLAGLPRETAIYCGHEYTVENLRFAAAADPENHGVIDLLNQLTDNPKSCTVPGTIETELATNPFLRTTSPSVVKQARAQENMSHTTSADVFATLRRWKDRF